MLEIEKILKCHFKATIPQNNMKVHNCFLNLGYEISDARTINSSSEHIYNLIISKF